MQVHVFVYGEVQNFVIIIANGIKIDSSIIEVPISKVSND